MSLEISIVEIIKEEKEREREREREARVTVPNALAVNDITSFRARAL